MTRAYDAEWLWVSAQGGDMLTPDAMDQVIAEHRSALVGRTASTVVLRQADGTEVTFNRVPGGLLWI